MNKLSLLFCGLVFFFMNSVASAPPASGPNFELKCYPLEGDPIQVLSITKLIAPDGTETISGILITDNGDWTESFDILSQIEIEEFLKELESKAKE